MEEVLQELEALLRRYDCVLQANIVEMTRGALPARRRLHEILSSEDWWGGAGSVAEVDPAILGGFAPAARADARRLRELLLEVHAFMQDEGIEQPVADLLCAEFRKWLASNL
ncbi:MAG: hypothetical protein D6717_08495 [Gammaproteobacteria bacterium]|nr:MAG: hypothetical protein D6717_08495 [Gammaproteobacteria bacterium]